MNLIRVLFPLLLLGTASAATVTLQAGQTGPLGGQTLTVLSVQDSRCPVDVQCVRAGEVRASVLVRQSGHLRLLRLQLPDGTGTDWAGVRLSAANPKTTPARAPAQLTFSDEQD